MTADQQESTLSERIAQTVQAYVDRVAGGTAEEIVDLYADGATVEDPIGSPIKTSRSELVEFYGVIAGMDSREAVLNWSKVAGDTAVFGFTLVTGTGGMKFEVSPVDIMVFDENAKIVSMRAVWEPSDLKQI